jgi:hypothetical protein
VQWGAFWLPKPKEIKMKKWNFILAGVLALAASPALAEDDGNLARELFLANLQSEVLTSDRDAMNAINWKVGEFQEYDISSSFGNMGKVKKYVASEQGNAIWVNNDTSGGMIGNNKIEALIDRATGKVLEMRQNGQKQDVPNDPIELISQEATRITVPAGTFEVIHITARSKQAKKIEVWANPRDITMDGSAQMYVESGFLPMTLKLTKFGGR